MAVPSRCSKARCASCGRKSSGRSSADIAAKIVAIELIDATNAPIPIANLTFTAEEVGLQALGANIENSKLVPRLADLALQNPNIHLTEEWLDDIVYGEDDVSAHFTSGRQITARLIVAADGQRSTVRKKAGIGTRRWTYPQVALTALLAHELPHHDRSIEFHTRSGPCTLVPLLPRAEAPHRSSLVWLMSASEAERRKELPPPTSPTRSRPKWKRFSAPCGSTATSASIRWRA